MWWKYEAQIVTDHSCCICSEKDEVCKPRCMSDPPNESDLACWLKFAWVLLKLLWASEVYKSFLCEQISGCSFNEWRSSLWDSSKNQRHTVDFCSMWSLRHAQSLCAPDCLTTMAIIISTRQVYVGVLWVYGLWTLPCATYYVISATITLC